jgi:hypothetical protein
MPAVARVTIDEPGRGLKKWNMVKNKKHYFNFELCFFDVIVCQVENPMGPKNQFCRY